MEPRALLDALTTAVRLKDTARHCYTQGGRQESVAEHSWMMTLMAFFLRGEFPEADMNKVLNMCVIHDLGECFTGDIPTFEKNTGHEDQEKRLLSAWVASLPEEVSREMKALYEEMEARETPEARIYKAIDSLEALIQHNFSHLSTWSEHEKTFNLTYADDKVEFSRYMTKLRQEILEDTRKKIAGTPSTVV